jgi:hypothetical protein
MASEDLTLDELFALEKDKTAGDVDYSSPSRHSPSTKGFRHTLRHDGVDYGNYIEQLEPHDLAGDAVTELEAVIDDLKEIVELIERGEDMEK